MKEMQDYLNHKFKEALLRGGPELTARDERNFMSGIQQYNAQTKKRFRFVLFLGSIAAISLGSSIYLYNIKSHNLSQQIGTNTNIVNNEIEKKSNSIVLKPSSKEELNQGLLNNQNTFDNKISSVKNSKDHSNGAFSEHKNPTVEQSFLIDLSNSKSHHSAIGSTNPTESVSTAAEKDIFVAIHNDNLVTENMRGRGLEFFPYSYRNWPELNSNYRKLRSIGVKKEKQIENWQFQLHTGYEFVNSFWQINNDLSLARQYKEFTKSAQTKGLGFSSQLLVQRHIFNGISLGLGLSYQRFNLNHSFKNKVKEIQQFDQATNTWVWVELDETAQYSVENQKGNLSMLSLPMYLQWNKAVGKHNLIFGAGAVFQLNNASQLNFYNLNTRSFDKIELIPNELSYFTQIGYQYQFSKRVSCGITVSNQNLQLSSKLNSLPAKMDLSSIRITPLISVKF